MSRSTSVFDMWEPMRTVSNIFLPIRVEILAPHVILMKPLLDRRNPLRPLLARGGCPLGQGYTVRFHRSRFKGCILKTHYFKCVQ